MPVWTQWVAGFRSSRAGGSPVSQSGDGHDGFGHGRQRVKTAVRAAIRGGPRAADPRGCRPADGLWACCGLRAGWRPACSESSTIRGSGFGRISTWVTRERSPSLAGLSKVRRTWTSACSEYGAAPCVRTTRSSASGTSCSPGCGGSAASGWWPRPGGARFWCSETMNSASRGVGVPGFDEIYSVLYAGGDPPLLMTHFPLRRVPGGVREPARPSSQRDRAGQHPSHQRLRRAGALSAKIADGDPAAREAPGSG